MVNKFYKSLLGEDWFQSFHSFRLNPETFLDKRKLTRDAFCLDVLKELYLDYIEIQNKIHLLLLLQEYSSILIRDANLLEQVVGSLVNLYDVLGTKPEKNLLKCQILITIITILLSQTLDHDFSRLLLKVKSLLLSIIYNSSEDSKVISTGCQCLEEIERCYPGSLEVELANLQKASEKETSPAFQSFALLLSVAIKNTVAKQQNKSGSLLQNVDNVKDLQISSLVSHLLEILPYTTYTAMHRILKELTFVVKHTPADLSPMIFKLYLQNIMMSSDVSLLNFAFDLQEIFGSALVSSQEEMLLFTQIIKLSAHPCLTASHRLIFLEWIKCWSLNTNISEYPDLHIVLPAPFDGPLTQEKKSSVLCSSIPPHAEEDTVRDFLNECINGLTKCSLLSGGTKTAPSLFRTLFVFFCKHTSDCIQNAIYKLLTGMIKTSPHLTPYSLSFLQAVKQRCPERRFHQRILGHLVEHILSIPIKQFSSNLENYLSILEFGSKEHAALCRPKATLRFIQKLLSDADFKFTNTWQTGNDILSVCCTILKHHDVQIIYYELAEVLCFVSQKFDDADVKDRAKIYYTMLTSLSKLKIQSIFSIQSSVKDQRNALNNFVAGGDSSQFICIQKLSNPILKLTRIENPPSITDTEIREADTLKIECITNVLETYQSYLLESEPSLELPFILQAIKTEENNFSDLYGIIIKTNSEPASKEISTVEIPVLKNLKRTENKGIIVNLSLKPLEPYPLILHFKSEFTSDRGYNYSCHLPSVALKFVDLFMPLPVPESVAIPVNQWRQMLFDNLWNFFKENIDSSKPGSSYCQSLFCVKTGKEFFAIVEEKWKDFIIFKVADDTYNIGIYLLPGNHILMKLNLVNYKPFIQVVVDNNAILPWITACIQDMKESSN